MNRRPLLLLALVAGCEPWPEHVDGSMSVESLWDPVGVVAGGDAVFARLPHAGEVVQLARGADPVRLDVEPARYTELIASPDGATVLARKVLRVCDSDQEEPVEEVGCDGDVVEQGTLDVLAPEGLPTTTFDLGAWYTSFRFSDDGRFVVALQDPDATTVGGGVVNLTSVLVIDLQAGTSWEVSVGFEARRVLFLGHGEAGTTGMVVLSQSEVAVVDLTAAVPVPGAVFPLTLDADAVVQPVGVALTPDDAYALITVEGTSDLYVLDLVDPSINLVSLAGPPAAMAVDAVNDRTVFVYANQSVVEVLDHRFFELTTVDLDETSTRIWMGPGFAVLSNPQGKDVYRLDLADVHVDEYRLDWPPQRLEVDPGGQFAVSLADDAGAGRLEVLDLRVVDGRVDAKPKPFGLSGRALDLELADGADGTTALLLQQGVDTLFQLSWPSLHVGEVELPAAPVAIGRVGDGGFFVTHDDDLGLISFYEPGADLVTVGGFAAFGFHDQPQVVLPVEE